jgi:hypothetical protein
MIGVFSVDICKEFNNFYAKGVGIDQRKDHGDETGAGIKQSNDFIIFFYN